MMSACGTIRALRFRQCAGRQELYAALRREIVGSVTILIVKITGSGLLEFAGLVADHQTVIDSSHHRLRGAEKPLDDKPQAIGHGGGA